VLCVAPNGSVKLETAHDTHCDGSSHHKNSASSCSDSKNHEEGFHDFCDKNDHHEKSTSKFIDECLVHCSDVSITVPNAVTTSSPKTETLLPLYLSYRSYFQKSSQYHFQNREGPDYLKTLKLDKSTNLNIIRTIVLTV
jgi:hypothetical protein